MLRNQSSLHCKQPDNIVCIFQLILCPILKNNMNQWKQMIVVEQAQLDVSF